MQVRCELCPRRCVIPPGASGDCRVRVNLDGELKAVTYGFPVSAHVDPIEKKPLYHYLPGTSILSIATVGCTLHCLNCQNWEISQANPEETDAFSAPPADVVAAARRAGSPSIAYTYTDPVAYFEYALDTSRAAREAGLRNVLVTAGYANPTFHPQHRLTNLPPTPAATLLRARELARAEGLRYVYVGNVGVPGGGTTRCPSCDAVLLERQGFSVLVNALRPDGTCPGCGALVPGGWR